MQSKSVDWFLYDRNLRHERGNEWKWIYPKIRSSSSYKIFRKALLNVVKTVELFNINESLWIKMFTKLILSFSHLREHKFKYDFKYVLNWLCSCSIEVEMIISCTAIGLIETKQPLEWLSKYRYFIFYSW